MAQQRQMQATAVWRARTPMRPAARRTASRELGLCNFGTIRVGSQLTSVAMSWAGFLTPINAHEQFHPLEKDELNSALHPQPFGWEMKQCIGCKWTHLLTLKTRRSKGIQRFSLTCFFDHLKHNALLHYRSLKILNCDILKFWLHNNSILWTLCFYSALVFKASAVEALQF